MPGGRPSKYKPEFCEQLISFMSEGYSFEAFAGEIEVAIDSISKWVNEHKEFSEAKKIGQAISRKWWETAGQNGMYAGKAFNPTVWIFAMKNRFGWKDQLALSTDSELPITVSYDHSVPMNAI